MKQIYKLFTRKLRLFGAAVTLVEIVTYTFSFLFSGLAKKDIFNVLEGKEVTLGITSLNLLILINVLAPLIINVVKQINSGLAEKLKTKIRYNIKSLLMEYALNVSFSDQKNLTEGKILNYYRNECEDIVNYFMEFYNQSPKLVLSAAILIVMFFTNPVFAFVSIIPTAIMVLLVKALSKRIFAYRTSARNKNGEVTGFLNTFFENIEFFYMVGDKNKIIDIYFQKCTERSKSEIKDQILDRLLSAISSNSSNFALGIILLIALPFMVSGKFTVGEFVMFGYYYAFLAYLPDAITSLSKRKKQTRVSLERIHIILEEGINPHGTVTEANGLLINAEINGASKSVKADKGDIIVIQSNNGSTLLKTLFLLCSHNCKNNLCAYVPREPVLFDESIRENICMDKKYKKDMMETILAKTDLLEDIASFEEGISKPSGKKGESLSGGQRKRIGIARALYSEADILFIDGLTDCVDWDTGQKLIDGVLGKYEGIIFIASESLNTEKIADRIVYI